MCTTQSPNKNYLKSEKEEKNKINKKIKLPKVSVFDLQIKMLCTFWEMTNKHIGDGICITSTEEKVNSFIIYLKF